MKQITRPTQTQLYHTALAIFFAPSIVMIYFSIIKQDCFSIGQWSTAILMLLVACIVISLTELARIIESYLTAKDG